jgi:hypothetical protein
MLLLAGCLISTDLYNQRLDQLTDHDGDGYVFEDDCDDTDDTVHPDADETCDAADQDCDGRIDEDPVDPASWYADADGDGYGAGEPELACAAPGGTVANAEDCDDGTADVSPVAEEVPYDGADNDCVGGDVTDVDGDGHDALVAGGDDCDDASASSFPGAEETWYDGVDQDCDGADADDRDGDGYASTAAGGGDCDDENVEVFPGAEETWANGVTDNDCDGELEPARLEFGASAWLGESAFGEAGRRVGKLGDVDGDGLAEYLVGAVYEASAYENGGAVYLVPGGQASGELADVPSLRPGGASWYLPGPIDGGPDVDGDGVPDLVTGAPGADAFAGGAWLVSGAAFSGELTLPDAAFASVSGDAPGEFGGTEARFLGDVMGDGGEWLAVSSLFAEVDGMTEAGRVGLFEASTLGDVAVSDADVRLDGYFTGGQVGNHVESAGDIDGDGIDDYLASLQSGVLAMILPGGVTAPDPESGYLFRLLESDDVPTCVPTMLGDVDGDGARDLACFYDDSHIQVYTALAGDPTRTIVDESATIEVGEGSLLYDVRDVGDLDGDGRAETVVPLQWDTRVESSQLYVVFGDQLTWHATVSVDDSLLSAVSVRPEGRFGYRLVVSEDVDGDGGRDLILGGYSDSQGGEEAGAVIGISVPR